MSYNFLKQEKSPRILVKGYELIGIKEIVGKDHNPKILVWAKTFGLEKIYTSDELPWCGLFIAYVCHQAGLDIVKGPLWARNWATWGTKQTVAMLGDILVFPRGTGGHVGIYVGEDHKCYHVLGGNQNNSVSVVRINKDRCIAIRRTPWKIAQPDNVRIIKLSDVGAISTNEA